MTVHGKVVYLEIPTADEEVSAAFYKSVFGWRIRTRGDGALAFDDATEAAGGEIVQDVGGDPGELTSRFRDPYGNLVALYQEPTR